MSYMPRLEDSAAAGCVGALAALRLPFSGSCPSLHEGFPSAVVAEPFLSSLGSRESHKGRHSAPACSLCPSIPIRVTRCWPCMALSRSRGAFPPLGSRAVAVAIEEGSVLQVGGTDTRSGERVCCHHAPSSLPKVGVPDGRTSDGGMGSS